MGGLLSKKEEDNKGKEKPTAVTRFTCQPYVLRRVSSMFFDEDGDLAHEFYEEHKTQSSTGSVRWTMKKLRHHGIRPQGEIDLSIPRLHVDLPMVLVENV
jgi:hypothetical protein